jgi:glycosyltransferase involved in cell wall biosynthesis
MVPYGANIVNAMEAENVYAIFVSKGQWLYRKIVKENPKYTFIEMPSGKLATLFFKLFPLKLIFTIKKICRQEKIDIIHFLTGEFIVGYFMFLLPKIRVIYTVHDAIPHSNWQFSLSYLYRSLFIYKPTKTIIHKSNDLVTNSIEQQIYLRKTFPQKNVFFHHFPSLITNEILTGTIKCYELINEKNYILFFGSVYSYKGVEDLYNAYIDNEGINKNYKLVIAGLGDWYFPRRLNKEENIIRINRMILDSEIKALFENASCVVYPYHSATQSGVLSLAYKFRTPLLASDVDFFKNNIINGKTGLLFERKGTVDLYEKLIELLYWTDKEAMGKYQQEFFNTNYSEKTLLAELNFIYNHSIK